MDTDRNLLFAVLALQADVLSQSQFVEGCTLWASRKSQTLADLLLDRGWITAEDRAHVDYLLDRKLARHGGDIKASLAHVTGDQVRQTLSAIDDPAVQDSLASLSALHGALPATTDHRPVRRDRYTVTRLHARGGIGQVWLAHDHALGREVALKELRPERVGEPGLVARFLQEAKVTGQLAHPGVVPIYDLDRTAGDRPPFYTMRFINGRTLREAGRAYHQRRQAGQATALELRQLLGAFVVVCNAVAYAHARGVLHRDLKGSNVVLGDFGEVMLLDWGMAKVVGDGAGPAGGAAAGSGPAPVNVADDETPDPTVAGQVLGTPACMAPEQAAGQLDRIDRRTDVYGLGAMLYEILTGRLPYSGGSHQEVLRKVLTEAAPRPRQAVAGTPPALEAICLKALAKRPEQRYQAAAEVALEVQRFLADEPVAAYREPPAARAARWMRRHRTAVGSAVAAVAVAALCLGVASGLLLAAYGEADRQRIRASAQRDKAHALFLLARTAVDQFHTRVSESPELKAHGLELLRQKLLESAVSYYEEFVRQREDDPGLRLEQGRACIRLADLAHVLGRNEQARASYRRAQTIFKQLAEENPHHGPYQEELALCDWKLGLMYHDAGRYALAEPPYKEGLALAERLCAARPDAIAYQQDLGNLRHSLARLYRDSGRFALAEPLYDQALALRRRLVKDHPAVAVYQDELAWTLFNLANLYNRTGRRDLSEKTYVENLGIWKRLARAHPESPDYQDQIGMTLNNLGNVYENTGRPRKAEGTRLEALKVRRRLADRHPQVEDYQEALCKILENLGSGYQMTGRLDLAERSYREALTIRRRLMDRYPDILDIPAHHVENEANMGLLCRDRGRWAQALDWYGRAARRARAVLQKEPNHATARSTLASVENKRAVVLAKLGRRAEAEQALARAAREGAAPAGRESRVCRALVRAYAGDHAGASALANDVSRETGLTGYERLELARIYSLCGEAARAVEVLRQARAAGYLQSAASALRLRKDAELAPLSSDEAFRALVAELERTQK
jgi:serine/threonine-protein kinase